jgi:hypothetical protein
LGTTTSRVISAIGFSSRVGGGVRSRRVGPGGV